MNVLYWISEIGFSGFLDIIFIWFIIFTLLVWSKKTKSMSVLAGILIVSGIYLVTRQLNMVLAAGLLEKFFAIIIIALVVIFQEELRYFFEQIAIWSTAQSLGRRKKLEVLSREEVDILIRTLKDLAKDKVGVLIVIRGKDLIVRHLEGGIELNGKISEALLKSLFDASSIGHDGAIYIEGNNVVKFSCHLPLSKNLEKVGKGGTRHSAALGLAELCDALCIAVSEERGTISIARHGKLKVVSSIDELRSIITKFYDEVRPRLKAKPWEEILKKNYREKIIGLVIACVIWFVLVYGGRMVYKTFTVPVAYSSLSADLEVKQITPDKIYVTLEGQRKSFTFLNSNKIGVLVNPAASKGIQKIKIYQTNFEIPKEFNLEIFAPQEVEFNIGKTIALEQEIQRKGSEGLVDMIKSVLPIKQQASSDVDKNESQQQLNDAQNIPIKKSQVETVKDLIDANPKEVVQYLEQKIDSKNIVENTKTESQNNK